MRESSNSAKGYCNKSEGQQDDIWQYANGSAAAAEAEIPLWGSYAAYSEATVAKGFHYYTWKLYGKFWKNKILWAAVLKNKFIMLKFQHANGM